MSLKLISEELDRFLSNPEPEVLCLRGGWGVGKTFLWNQRLDTADKEGIAALDAYSYVSLFGLKNLAELRLSVFQNCQSLNGSKRKRGVRDLESYVNNTVGWRSKIGLLKAVPFVGNLSDDDAASLLSSVLSQKQFVCIDDIERRGSGLGVKEVLGYASFLKEEKRSKVVILLNEGELGDKGAEEFQQHGEKVVDISLTMKPTASEAVRIAFPKPSDLQQKVAERCVALSISNIRVIRRAEKVCQAIMPQLSRDGAPLVDSVISSLVLFSWARDQPNEAPSHDFLAKIDAVSIFREYTKEDDQEPDEELAKWMPMLEAYGYGESDAVDVALMKSVRDGYFDPVALEPLLNEWRDRFENIEADSAFSKAWSVYHNSFDNNQSEVLDGLYDAFKENFDHISVVNVLGTFRLFIDLGEEARAQELVQFYVSHRQEEREFFDLDSNYFIEDPIDPYFREAFDNRRDELHQERSFKSALLSITDSWSPDDVTIVAAAPVETYVETFKEHNGAEMRRLVESATRFSRISNPTDDMKTVTKKAMEALKVIGQESPINARRVAKYGVRVKPITE
ncbi:hypothetical protein [Thioclava sp. DLFJ4-1]|uniref:hypothetical protein n=1 Tax=Thioclava sp. DLFJ4-1 TaxID=1915313 RepID=UPI000996B15D|nr:hypothetical protein [Thioclava sp. DLFJ4-1]OOY14323.1 hypothetical protein BMI85_20815 [Thioclava sp. DLFJ4-1]